MDQPIVIHTSYKKGLKRVIVFYLTGLLATFIFHLVTGWNNPYAPPLSIMVLLCVVVIGLLWAVLNITSLFNSKARPQSLGELTVHSLVVALSAALILAKAGII